MPKKPTASDLSNQSAHELVEDALLPQEQNLVEEGLGYLEQGISIFDNDLRLVAANEHFVELLDFPKEFGTPGTPLENMFRYNAKRGEYGPGDIEQHVRDRLEKAHEHNPHCFQRVRPDGIVLEIQGVPIKDFGFVTTYTNISERIQTAEALHHSHERFQDMARAASDWFWELDENLRFTFLSDRFYRAFNLPPQHVIGKTREEIADPQDIINNPENWNAYYQAIKNRKPFRGFDYCILNESNKRLYLKVSGVPVFDKDGVFKGYRGTGTDFTALREAELALEENAKHFRNVLDSSAAGVAITSRKDGAFKYANPRLAGMFHCCVNELMQNRPQFYYHNDKHWKKIVARFNQNGEVRDEEVEFEREDGSTFWALVTLQETEFENEKCILTWLYDVTELRNSREELSKLAKTDPLTGLANRRMFKEQVERAIARAHRQKSNGALIYFDLDGFKDINDVFGHDQGDKMLQQVASRVLKQLRTTDVLSRLGGDEFTILIEDIDEQDKAVKVAQKILDTIEEPFPHGGKNLQISASIGIAFFDHNHQEAEAVIIHADRAMYHAKNSGRGCIKVYNG